MSEEKAQVAYNDEKVDAIAVTALIAIVVTGVVFWLTGMPL